MSQAERPAETQRTRLERMWRRADQPALAAIAAFSLLAIGWWWWDQGGSAGRLIDLDRQNEAPERADSSPPQVDEGLALPTSSPPESARERLGSRSPPRLLVDPNAADWVELALLPDIGETLAKRIVETRLAQGPYRIAEDLRRVRGIGPKTLEKIRPFLQLPSDAPDR